MTWRDDLWLVLVPLLLFIFLSSSPFPLHLFFSSLYFFLSSSPHVLLFSSTPPLHLFSILMFVQLLQRKKNHALYFLILDFVYYSKINTPSTVSKAFPCTLYISHVSVWRVILNHHELFSCSCHIINPAQNCFFLMLFVMNREPVELVTGCSVGSRHGVTD